MVAIQLTGHVDENGRVELSEKIGLPPGDVTITIEPVSIEDEAAGAFDELLAGPISSRKALTERRVLIYPGEDGYWVVEVPSLPGCISQGKTRSEALINIKEAIELWIEGALEDGEEIPDDRQMDLVEVV